MLRRFEEVFTREHDSQGVDEIVGNLRSEGKEMVSTSTMYNFIHRYKKEWEYWLRYGKH
jgi:sugar phosphate isomerase/epimerase